MANDLLCADCGKPVGQDAGPKDGWQLEDGRTVCQACCVRVTVQLINLVTAQLVKLAERINGGSAAEIGP
jgi:hypothetical protein